VAQEVRGSGSSRNLLRCKALFRVSLRCQIKRQHEGQARTTLAAVSDSPHRLPALLAGKTCHTVSHLARS